MTSCLTKEEVKEEIPQIKVEEVSEDIRIPRKIWDYFWTDADNFIFSEVSVVLKEKNLGVLKETPVEIVFTEGGGVVNLREHLTGETGTFYLNFNIPAFEEADEVRVFFVSQSHQLRIGKEVIGAGCNKLLQITDAFKKNQSKEGIILNTFEGRHLAVAGGTFIFAAKKGAQNFITQVTVRDSQYEELSCVGGE